MKKIARLSTGIAALLGVVMLLPAASHATTSVGSRSACSSSGDFTVAIGYDQSTQKPTVNHASNSTCVMSGNTISFTTALAGWSWSVSFPSQTAGGSVFTNDCTFGNGSGQSSTCTVISTPASGDYNYAVTLTDQNGNSHVLDPKVIIKGLGKRRHHPTAAGEKKATAPAQPPPPQ